MIFPGWIVSNAPILAILIPMGAAGIALTGKVFPRFRGLRQIAIVALLPGVIVLAATIGPVFWTGTVVRYALGGFTMEPGIILVLDGLAWVSSALITFVSILVSVASLSDRRFDATYFFFLLMTVAGMQSVVFTGDLFTMFVSFEIVAIGVYVLIAWERTPQGLLASLKYLFLSSVGILFFLLGIFLVYRDLGTLSMLRIVELAPELPALGADPGGYSLQRDHPGRSRWRSPRCASESAFVRRSFRFTRGCPRLTHGHRIPSRRSFRGS
jgi:multicomponent Na+:H+ antiporter subunit D